MLYPDKVRQALEASLSSFQAWDASHARELASYRHGLDRLGERSREEIEALLAEVNSPGALPSEEHGSPIVLPFGKQFGNHEEARAWAFDRIRDVTTLAVDGSQILPTKDYSYGVAAVQVAWFENRHRGECRDYVKDARFELLPPSLEREDGQGGGQLTQDTNLRRFEAEVEEIARHMREWRWQDPARPPVAFFDGTLAVSFAAMLSPGIRDRYVRSILRLIQASEGARVPVVGFVDTSFARDLCSLLAHLEGIARPARINDAHLLRGRMKWGDRTRAFVCGRDQILNYYAMETEGIDYRREVAFLYLQTTGEGPPARVDIPRWVVREGLVEHVADVIRCEVIAGTGYPYCLETVDAAAVLSTADRELFYSQLQLFCDRNGMKLRLAPKAASKRRRRV